MACRLIFSTSRLPPASAWCCGFPILPASCRHRDSSRPRTIRALPTPELPDWVVRANRTHINLVENLPSFAALVLVAHVAGAANGTTAAAAAVFFWARLAHALVFLFGIPYLRTADLRRRRIRATGDLLGDCRLKGTHVRQMTARKRSGRRVPVLVAVALCDYGGCNSRNCLCLSKVARPAGQSGHGRRVA